ncbi:MAG TPA: IS5 family transposase [Candidatus Binatia bacterium]|nr:IS5 family transposase [Candidatus Binatia bacterium]
MKQKTPYRIRNWPAYNAALIGRGSLTLWVDEAAIRSWRYTGPTQRGAQYHYTDAAISCVLTLRAVYHLALRAAEGLARSVFAPLAVSLPVPSYSTLSRRAAELTIVLGALPRTTPLHLVIDPSGFKVYGEGEWEVRQHGWRKRRTWRKRHLAVDEATGEIVAAVASEAGVSDDEVLPDLLAQVPGVICQVSAAGAYDKRPCYDALAECGATAVIPPRRAAKIWQHGNCAGAPWQRDENSRAIRRRGRRRWEQESGYQRRSLAEPTFFRCKRLVGPTLRARAFPRQATELFLKVAALNRMTHLGMPESYRRVP